MHEGTRYGPQTHPQFDVREPDAYAPTMDGKIKAPPSAGRMWLFGVEIFEVWHTGPAGTFARNTKIFNAPRAISVIGECPLRNDHAGR
jgi:hypothetical protein